MPVARGQLYVIRHGETSWSATGRHTGHTDIDLTEAGVADATALGVSLAGVDFAEVRVSPLRRARRTADLAGLGPVVVDADLMEWDYGGYEGLTTPEISERLGRDWTVWTDGVVPGQTPGETIGDLGHRLDRVIERVLARLVDGDVALVAHGHSLRVLTARWLGLDPEWGAAFRLGTATYGVLGFEHARQVVCRWSLR